MIKTSELILFRSLYSPLSIKAYISPWRSPTHFHKLFDLWPQFRWIITVDGDGARGGLSSEPFLIFCSSIKHWSARPQLTSTIVFGGNRQSLIRKAETVIHTFAVGNRGSTDLPHLQPSVLRRILQRVLPIWFIFGAQLATVFQERFYGGKFLLWNSPTKSHICSGGIYQMWSICFRFTSAHCRGPKRPHKNKQWLLRIKIHTGWGLFGYDSRGFVCWNAKACCPCCSLSHL